MCVCVFKERIESVSTEDSLVWSEREQGPKEAMLKWKRGSKEVGGSQEDIAA